jgi:hypothetical protein
MKFVSFANTCERNALLISECIRIRIRSHGKATIFSWSKSMELTDWPNCASIDCMHKACLWAGTGLCYPCSEQLLGKEEMKRRYEITHDAEDE